MRVPYLTAGIALPLVLILISISCSPLGPAPTEGALVLALDGLSGAAVERVRVRVTASDIASELWAELEIDGSSASGEIECPPGYNRLVEVDIYVSDRVAFSAAGRVDLEPGQTAELSLTAYPVDDPRLAVAGRRGAFGDHSWQYRLPTDAAASGDGGLYVVDPEAGSLTAYRADGSVRYRVGLEEQDGYSPSTLCLLPDGALLIGDPVNRRLDLFEAADGSHRGRWELPSGFGEAGALAFWPEGEAALVVDGGRSQLVLFDLDGEFLYERPLENAARNPLESPVGLALIDSGPEMILFTVSDASRGEVYLYRYYVGENIENMGRLEGAELRQPLGMGLAGDILFVADATRARLELYLFDRSSYRFSHLASYGAPGERLGTFTLPTAVSYGADLLWVVDAGNHRLQYFELH